MRSQIFGIASLILAAFSFVSCDDKPPETIIVPPSETPRSKIDNYYYVKFGWGKASNGDTITMEVPDLITYADSTINYDSLDPRLDYFMEVFDFKNEVVLDTTAAELLEEGEKPMKIHWHYAPTVALFNYTTRDFIDEDDNDKEDPYWEFLNDPYKLDLREKILNPGFDPYKVDPEDTDEEAEAYKNIFFMSFPWLVKNDTLGFWDIAEYLENPSIKMGSVRWGRIGNGLTKDTLWNNDASDGIMIHYRDEKGVVWESDNDPTFQDGSYFVIDKKMHRNSANGDGRSYFVIQGQFSAMLYNDRKEGIRATGEYRVNILDDVELSAQPE